MLIRTMAALYLTAATMPALAADTAATTAAAFGARENVQQISLSPDGTHVAMIVPTTGSGNAVVVLDLAKTDMPRPILTSRGDPERLTRCDWSTDIRLVCQFYAFAQGGQGRIGFSRLISMGPDGSDLKLISAKTNDNQLALMQEGGTVIDWLADGTPGSALITRKFVPEASLGTRLYNIREGLGVERVDTTTLARRTVEPARADAKEYISDGRGTVRVMGTRGKTGSGYDRAQIDYFYRLKGKPAWQPLSHIDSAADDATGFDPYAVDSGLDIAYGFDTKDGRRALYRVALDGSMKRELVLDRSDVDVAGLVRIGRQNRVVGASYVTDRRHTEFFDPALRKLQAALGRALPAQPLVTFIDASADESKLLLFAGSDTDPGQYYLFDKTTRKMEPILPARAQLTGTPLATMKAITFPAADGTPIPGYLTLPPGRDGRNIPAIVMPHGGPGSRDEWGFDWLVQFFAARGYAVLQPNFRGSTGYGQAWFQKNGFRSWRTAIGDVDDAGRWLVKQGIAAPDKLAIVGWSYGGYAALQSGVVEPGLFKAIVAIAPVTDLDALREESRNFTSFAMVDAFIGEGPHIREGSPARNAVRITVPVLMFHGDRDTNVGIGESRLMEKKLKAAGAKVELVQFKGLDHQLDDAAARTTMLDKADNFLRATMKM